MTENINCYIIPTSQTDQQSPEVTLGKLGVCPKKLSKRFCVCCCFESFYRQLNMTSVETAAHVNVICLWSAGVSKPCDAYARSVYTEVSAMLMVHTLSVKELT